MIILLSSKNYNDTDHNHGDCIIYIENGTAVIYDCGSEDHAKRAIDILNKNNINKATVILSHNDSDHFDGIPYLIEKGKVKELYTILLLKYKDDILEAIDDKRRKRDSVGKSIKEIYSNIASLSEKVTLKDVYEGGNNLPVSCEFIGPKYEYMIKAVAKGIDSRQGDTIDKETIVNATSVQIKISTQGKTVLLTGDCTPEAIPEIVDLKKYDYIQLPHHGKYIHAASIFERTKNANHIVYLVSDNTGTSNGGSDELMKNSKGHRIKNTKSGDTSLNLSTSHISLPYTGVSLGI